MGDHRLERPDQPQVLRHLRVPEGVRLRQAQGREAHARCASPGQGGGVQRHPRGNGTGRRDPARLRLVGHGEPRPVSGAGRREPGRGDPPAGAPAEEGPAGGARDGGAPDEEETTGAFRRSRGRVSARFTAAQAVILRNLVSQVAELMGGGEADSGGAGAAAGPGPGGQGTGAGPGEPVLSAEDLAAMIGATGPSSPPADPVLARLLPDAYRDDPEAAGEFRRYTEQGLRSGKVAAAQTVLATLPA